LPAALDEVLLRGLVRDPHERYATVEEFGRDLNHILSPPRRHISVWAALVTVALVLAGAGYVLLNRAPGNSENNAKAAMNLAPIRGWLVYRTPDTIWGFEKLPLEVGGTPLSHVSLQHQPPGTKLDAQIPDWPYPLPVLVLTSPERWCFFHPLDRDAFGPAVTAEWSTLFGIPPLKSQENYVRAGHFEGDCLGGDAAIWRKSGSQMDKGAAPITTLAIPGDRSENQALCLTKTQSNASQEMVCYQWLARDPRPRTIMILRYRARSEAGDASVAIGVVHPLFIPKSDKSDLANRLRDLKPADTPPSATSDTDFVEYWVNDWVTPTRDWQTYCVVWQWPPYCANTSRNVVVQFGGEDKVWIDTVELFTWDREAAR